MKTTKRTLHLSLAAIAASVFAAGVQAADYEVPDLTGKWHGHHYSLTAHEGYVDRENTITVTEQKGSRFTGTVEHAGGSENFIGIIRNNNRTFYWVDTKDNGIVEGEVIRSGVIETCYLEAGADAVVGCTVLIRER